MVSRPAFGQPPGDVDEHGLERLPVRVEGLLAEIGGAASEVALGGLEREVAQLEPLVAMRRTI